MRIRKRLGKGRDFHEQARPAPLRAQITSGGQRLLTIKMKCFEPAL